MLRLRKKNFLFIVEGHRWLLWLGCLFWLWGQVPPSVAQTGEVIRINFQDAETVPLDGYWRDFGEAYELRTGKHQGDGLTYGWVVPYTDSPLDMTMVGRNRLNEDAVDVALPLATLMHMEHAPSGLRGHWQIELPNGQYEVRVAVGDASFFTSQHWVSGNDQVLVAAFNPTEAEPFGMATGIVWVNNGRLTLHDSGGDRTKINYVEIEPVDVSERPAVRISTPVNGETGVEVTSGVGLDLYLPNDAVDPATLTADSVRLIRLRDGAQVAANLNTTGGGDAIVLQPQAPLLPNTPHLLEVNEGVQDLSGATFVPYRTFFVTAGEGGETTGESVVRFDRTVVAEGLPFTSLLLGPDGHLYASTVDGRLARFEIGADGTLSSAQVINTVANAYGGEPRVILGLAFDPAATPNDLILWISHGAPIASGGGAQPWTSRISRLSGPDLGVIEDYVINLPRSFRNHMTNGIAFGPDGLLYALQGSNASMGAPDNTWGFRPERLLSAAVLQIDTAKITAPPLDAKTEEGGSYDPFAPEAAVKVYATGVRNPYDLVWHSNGALYTGNNGSAAGGNAPETPTELPPSCQTARADGPYERNDVPPLTNVSPALNDYLFRVEAGGYYGHPNPLRCEWVLNGGNPTASVDVGEVGLYPVGTAADRNWRGFAYDFGVHFSPNGLIEYQNDAFNGYLQGKLLVVRYSRGDDIIALTPGLPDLDIVAAETGLPGLTGFQDPLDLVETPSNGNLYVIEFAPPAVQRISLLRPLAQDNAEPVIGVTVEIIEQTVTVATPNVAVTPTSGAMAIAATQVALRTVVAGVTASAEAAGTAEAAITPTPTSAGTAVSVETGVVPTGVVPTGVVPTGVVPTVVATETAVAIDTVVVPTPTNSAVEPADQEGDEIGFGLGILIGIVVTLILVYGAWLVRQIWYE